MKKTTPYQYNTLDFFNLEDIDFVVKFLYVKAKVENNNYEFYKNLYIKAILRFFGGVNDGKTNITEFIESFDALIESIQQKSFDPQYPITLSKDDMILNGRHRLAICAYFDIEPLFERKNDLGHKRFVMDLDFYKTVFSEFECETIIIDYLDNFKNEDYFFTFLWGDSEKKWDCIEDTFVKNDCIISYKKTFLFRDQNYFQNVLDGIYTYENGINNNTNILGKTQGMKGNMKFQTLLFKYPKSKTYRCNIVGFPICVEIEELKFEIRKQLSLDITVKNYSFLHTSDNYDHTRYLSHFIFGYNLGFLRKISYSNPYTKRTHDFLKQFEIFLEKNQVSRYDFCFESGIILQIFGIRKAADLDFICRKKLRNTLKLFSKDIDLHEENRFLQVSKLTDNEVISNRKNFFFYKGFKFISPHILIKNSSHLSKKKQLDMQELENFVNKEQKYETNILYKVKVFLLLKYYWLRRRFINILTIIFSKKQKYIIKKFLNKFFKQNYNLDHD